MYVDARESSITKNVKAIVEGIQGIRFYDTLTRCDDDRESDDLLHTGHLNAVVRKAIECGMDPVLAIKSATINTARGNRREPYRRSSARIHRGYGADKKTSIRCGPTPYSTAESWLQSMEN